MLRVVHRQTPQLRPLELLFWGGDLCTTCAKVKSFELYKACGHPVLVFGALVSELLSVPQLEEACLVNALIYGLVVFNALLLCPSQT